MKITKLVAIIHRCLCVYIEFILNKTLEPIEEFCIKIKITHEVSKLYQLLYNKHLKLLLYIPFFFCFTGTFEILNIPAHSIF